MIWLIGGTSETREILKVLEGRPILLSVATKAGQVQGEGFCPLILTGKLELPEMVELIKAYKVESIIDASHPFARNVSLNAMEAAERTGVFYLRYERPDLPCEGKVFGSFQEIAAYLKERRGNILLTIGTRNLSFFRGFERSRIFCRILPLAESVTAAEAAGFSLKQILALVGPFSVEFNRILIREYGIRFLVTKASGLQGGEMEKRAAAAAEGIELLSLKRPSLVYPHLVSLVRDIPGALTTRIE